MNKINYDLLFKEELKKIKNKRPSLLLHVCCGPCCGNVIMELCHYFDITIYYSNSNIYPEAEYTRRYKELVSFVSNLNQINNQQIKIIEKPYLPIEYLKKINSLKNEPEGGKRCFTCYQLRMNDCYQYALSYHFDYWTTVLSVSPHKKSQWINEIGQSFPQDQTKFLFADFKKNNGYQKSVQLANKYQLYRQNYCGCLYSYKDMLLRPKKELNQD